MLHDRAGCCVVLCGSVCTPWGQLRLTGCQAAAAYGCVLDLPGKGWQRAADGVAQRTIMHLWLSSDATGTLAAHSSPADVFCKCGYHSLACRNAVSRQACSNDMAAPSVHQSHTWVVCVPCFATLAAGGIRTVNHQGSDLPKVTWQGCVGAESTPPLTLVPLIMLAATARGYLLHTQGWYKCRNVRVDVAA